MVDAPLAELTQVTVTAVRGGACAVSRAGAHASDRHRYVFATEHQSNSTPRWWSIVSSAVFGGGALDDA